MSNYQERIQREREQFMADVSAHEMTVLRDDGLYRHLRFAKPGTSCMSFSLVTWPGHLCYTGDMGTYVFSRLPDMFDFFRGDLVNVDYWSEKLLGIDRDGVRAYSDEVFLQLVSEALNEQHRACEEISSGDYEALLEDARLNSDSEHEAHVWLRDTTHRGRVLFPDAWEWRLTEYTQRIVWCCHALPWAIQQYDKVKAAVQEEAQANGVRS